MYNSTYNYMYNSMYNSTYNYMYNSMYNYIYYCMYNYIYYCTYNYIYSNICIKLSKLLEKKKKEDIHGLKNKFNINPMKFIQIKKITFKMNKKYTKIKNKGTPLWFAFLEKLILTFP